MRFAPVCVTVAALLASGLGAGPVDLTLQHANIEDLSPAARAAYEEAVSAYDHADHVGAVMSMAQAAELAPEINELQLLFIDLAWQHVNLTNMSFEEAVGMAHQAITCYERLLSIPDAPQWALDLLGREYARLEDLLSNLEEIYAERIEVGNEIIGQLAEDRNRLMQLRQQQIAQARARYIQRQEEGDPNAPNPMFVEAAEARRRGSRGEGVGRVSAGVTSSRRGVERLH